eukprot:TRINITY_DN2723_c0_g2_i1.p1 TRINITY_DN2723_c0_g2~~TRINITY_DN2723_c0_g2_i1.p1  ORF type:complete len:732 (+),score=265.65 TRINITY_DN2723_c0_g2_i1:61-2256(+)
MGRKKTKQQDEAEVVETTEKKKDLFGSDDEDDAGITLNKEYAQDYEKEKRRKEFESLRARREYDEDSSEGTEEDEDGALLDTERDLKIFEALDALRKGDKTKAAEKITSVNAEVKDHLDSILKGSKNFKNEKKLTMKDYMRQQLLEKGAEGVATMQEDEENTFDRKPVKTTKEEADELKKAFIDAAEGEENDFAIGKTKDQPKNSSEKPSKDAREVNSKHEAEINERFNQLFSNVDPNDKNEQFLKGFFMNHGWQGDSYDPTEHEVEEILAKGDAEDDFEEDQIKFEEAYEKNKYHHEEAESAVIQSHPRAHLLQDSLRNEKSTRKTARDRKKEREQEEKTKRDEDVKRLKHLKRTEMNEKIGELKKMAGAKAEELFSLADLDDDFDPTEWDNKMSKMFDDTYYNEEDDFDPNDEEKPVFSDMEDMSLDGEDDSDNEAGKNTKGKQQKKPTPTFDPYGDDSDDSDASSLSSDSSSSSSSSSDGKKQPAKKKTKPDEKPKSKPQEKIPEEKKREMEKRKRQLMKQKEEDITKAMDSYTRLDYEGVVGGQKVRFKYRAVPKERFGLTDEDVFNTDDRTLNQIAPLKFYAPYKSRNDNSRDSYVAAQTKKQLQHLLDRDPDDVQVSKKYKTGMAPVYVEYNENAAQDDVNQLKKTVVDALNTSGSGKKKKVKESGEKRKKEPEEGKVEPVSETQPPKKKSKKDKKEKPTEKPLPAPVAEEKKQKKKKKVKKTDA